MIFNINFKISITTFFIIVFISSLIKNYVLSTQSYLPEAFATLPNHINYLHPSIEYMTIFHIYHKLPGIIYQLSHIDKQSEIFLHLIPFSTSNNISISVKRSNFNFVFFKAAYHANPGTERNFAGSSSYNLRLIFLKF